MSDLDSRLLALAAAPVLAVDEPRLNAARIRATRRRRTRALAALTVPVLLVGATLAGYAQLREPHADALVYAAGPRFTAPQPAPGRTRPASAVTSQAFSPAGPTVEVVASDAAAKQDVVQYRDRSGRECIGLIASMSSAFTCPGLHGAAVTFYGAGAARDRAGRQLGQPAVYGTAPSSATGVTVTAADGSTDTVQAFTGSGRPVNFFLSHANPDASIVSIVAYRADGKPVGRWSPRSRAAQSVPRSSANQTGPELGTIPTPPRLLATLPAGNPPPRDSVDVLARYVDGPATVGVLGWLPPAGAIPGTDVPLFCLTRYAEPTAGGQQSPEPAVCGPLTQNWNRLSLTRSLGVRAGGTLKQVLSGTAPQRATSVKLIAPAGETLQVPVFDAGADWAGSQHWAATWPARMPVTVVAMAEDGRELARLRQ